MGDELNSSSSFIVAGNAFNDFDVSASSVNGTTVSTPLPIHQSTPQRDFSCDFIEDVSWGPTSSIDVSNIHTSIDMSQNGMDAFHSSLAFNDFDVQPGCSSQQSNASQLLGSICCESRCLATLSVMEVESCRKSFESHAKTEQQQFLLDTISLTASKGGKRLCSALPLAGKQLCATAFIRVLNISKKRLRKMRNLHLANGTTVLQKRLCRDRPKSSKYSTASAWMQRYFSRIGDRMPHIEQIHLPHFLSKKIVYELMVQDLIDEGLCKESIISSSHFYAIWRQEFRNCIIPKV